MQVSARWKRQCNHLSLLLPASLPAVAFSTPAEAGENPQVSMHGRNQRSERQRTLLFCHLPAFTYKAAYLPFIEVKTGSSSSSGYARALLNTIIKQTHFDNLLSDWAIDYHLFLLRAKDAPPGRMDNEQVIACWSVSVGGLPPLLSHFA